jgi:DNA-directed RNA polymerase subunit RPC12/RpoP
MSKQVHKPRQVAHLWASGGQDSARNAGSGNFYFSGDTIYSYGSHFPIARLVPGAVLMTTRSYSNTTAKHIGFVRQALSSVQWNAVLFVANPAANRLSDHVANYLNMAERYRQLVQSAGKARQRKADILRQAEDIRTQAARYRKLFCKGGLRQCKPLPPVENAAAIIAAEDAKAAKQAAELEAKRQAAQAAELAVWNAGGLQDWKRNGWWHSPSLRLADDKTADIPSSAPINFRLLPDGETVRTTLGAEFPRRHCERVFRAIASCRAAGKAWQRNGRLIRVGHFQLDSIEPNGNIVAGCHNIRWDEIAAFAAELGIPDYVLSPDVALNSAAELYRHCTCLRCKHEWQSDVRRATHTPNISGEPTLRCPKCGSKEVMAELPPAPIGWTSVGTDHD